MVQWLQQEGSVFNTDSVLLCGVCMLSLWRFSQCTVTSSHSPKTCKMSATCNSELSVGLNGGVNACLFFCVSPVT